MLNGSSTLITAFQRAGLWAALVGLSTFLTAWGATNGLKGPIIAGGTAAIGILLTRGGFEGITDNSRQEAGDVRPSDVQPGIGQPPKS